MPWRHRRPLVLCLIAACLCAPAIASDSHGIYAAMQLAVTENPLVKSKLAEARAQGFRVKEAVGAKYPTATAETAARDNGSTGTALRVQQPLWGFGQIDAAIETAQAREILAGAELLQTRRQLMEEVVAAYASLVSATERLASAQKFGAMLTDLVRMIERRAAGGQASLADVRLAQGRKANAANLEVQLQQAVQRHRLELANLTRSMAIPIESFERLPLTLEPLAVYLDGIEASSVVIQSRKLAVAIIESELNLTRKQTYPMISLRVDKNLGSSALGASNPATRVSIVLEGRLQGGGVSAFNRIQSESQRLEAGRMNYESAVFEVIRKASSLHNDAATFGMNLRYFEEAIAANKETYESYLRQFDGGRKTWIEVLNSIREWGDLEQQALAIRSSYAERLLQLQAMTGRLDLKAGL